MKAVLIAVLLAVFFVGMVTGFFLEQNTASWWYAGENVGFVFALSGDGWGNESGTYIGYEVVGVPGPFWCLGGQIGDCPQ